MTAPTRAQEPLRHAQHLAMFHYATRRRRPWWPRVAALFVACAVLAAGVASLPQRADVVVVGRVVR